MDELDSKIKYVLNKDIEEHATYEYKIKTALNSKSKDSKRMYFKRSIAIAASLLFGTGMVFATSKTYENIWKEPTEVFWKNEITEEEKVTSITENEAKAKAQEYLKRFDIGNEVSYAKLEKSVFENEIIWCVGIPNGQMYLKNTGEFKSLNIPTSAYKIPKDFGITKEEAKKTAIELFQKYNPDKKVEDYKLVYLRSNGNPVEEAYIWYAGFYKKYDDKINLYESVEIGWVPMINGLYSYSEKNIKYENNVQIITKEEAIKIATEKDKKIAPNYQVKSTEANFGMDAMNVMVKYREEGLEDFETGFLRNYIQNESGAYVLKENAKFYKIQERVRNVWEVKFCYENGKKFIYFVDATTGEIIGGTISDGDQERIKQYISDPHNYAN